MCHLFLVTVWSINIAMSNKESLQTQADVSKM